MTTTQMSRALGSEETHRAESKATINHYKHLEGTTLAQVNLRATINIVDAPGLVCLNNLTKPVLLIIQPGASTTAQAEALKAEQAKIIAENSTAKCWMNTDGLPGCGGELNAWNELLYAEKDTMSVCSAMVLNLRDPGQQRTVMAEKKLNGMTLLSPQEVKDAEILLKQRANVLNEVSYMLRGALLIGPGGIVLRSYDLDLTPSKNPQLIYLRLVEDMRKIPKPKPVSTEADSALVSDVDPAPAERRSASAM